MIEGVSKTKRVNRSYQNGFGYIIVPSDVDRDQYIATCLREERVAIQLDFGMGFIQDCFITTSALREIKFPATPEELGSCVTFIGDEYHSAPVIIGVLSKRDESQLLEENVIKRDVSTKHASVNVESNGNTGEVFINVDSKFENGGSIIINLNSKNNTAKFNVNCYGDISLYSEGNTSLETLKTASIQVSHIDNGDKKLSSRIQLTQNGMNYEDLNGVKIDVNKDVNITCNRANIISDNIRLGGNKSIVVTDLPSGSEIPGLDCLIAGNITGN